MDYDLRNKLKSTIFCNSGFTYENDDESKILEFSYSKSPTSLSTWIRSELAPEIKVRCAGIFSGKNSRNRHRGNSAEFRYDSVSYALNFEDDDSRIDQYPLRNFASRLPQSPPNKIKNNSNVVVSREIAAWS